MVRSKSGTWPMLANSSRMKWTCVGRWPACRLSATLQSTSSVCHMRIAKRKSKVELVSGMLAKTTVLLPSSPSSSRPISSRSRSFETSLMDRGFRRTLQLMMIDLSVL